MDQAKQKQLTKPTNKMSIPLLRQQQTKVLLGVEITSPFKPEDGAIKAFFTYWLNEESIPYCSENKEGTDSLDQESSEAIGQLTATRYTKYRLNLSLH